MKPAGSKQTMKSTEIEFWDSRYRAGKTPWDFGGVPSALVKYLQTASPQRALIPGCGSGYEMRAFHERGWDVVAVDFSPSAVERARQVMGCLLYTSPSPRDRQKSRMP